MWQHRSRHPEESATAWGMASASLEQFALGFVIHATDSDNIEGTVGKQQVTSPPRDELEPIDFRSIWPNDAGFDTIREERTPIDLPVTGYIPSYAAGVLIRNGPGQHQIHDDAGQVVYGRSHWFDGFAQTHRFEISPTPEGSCSVTYQSRTQVDALLKDLQEKHDFSGYTFGQKRDPCESLFRKVASVFTPAPKLRADFANVGVTISANATGTERIHHGSSNPPLVARTDQGVLKTLDAETLGPTGICRQNELHPALTGPLSAAHAKSDETGDVFNYNLDIGKDTVYRVFHTSAVTGKAEILAMISSHEVPPAYIHSVFITDEFVILCVWNAHLAAGGTRILWEKNVLDAISPLDPSKPARWFVIDRRRGRGVVAKYESAALFCFHTINAWQEEHEDGSTDVICDLLEYNSMNILHKYYYDNIRASGPGASTFIREKNESSLPHFARYKLRDVLGSIGCPFGDRPSFSGIPYLPAERIMTIPSPIVGELPTINLAYARRPTRYFYCLTSESKSTFVEGLAKVDTMTGTSAKWDNPPGHTPSEAVLVPDPTGSAEDDGVLLTVVLDGFTASSYLLCLDARTMGELGRADCRGPINISFHGQHVRRDSGWRLIRPLDA